MTINPYLVLGDGTVIPDSQCGYYNNELHCWLTGYNLAEAFAMFSDPNKVSAIYFYHGPFVDTYEGFNDIFMVRKAAATTDIYLTGTDTHVRQNEPVDPAEDEEEEEEEVENDGDQNGEG